MSEKKFDGIKVLDVQEEYLIGAKGYKLFKYDFKSKKWKYEAILCDIKNSLLSTFFLTRRFFRAEITKLYTLNDGTQICIAKKGIFKREFGGCKFVKCFTVPRGSRPMNLCIDNNNHIYFGEYFTNAKKKPVHVYHSTDTGKSWDIAYTFPEGEINHIHGIFLDPYSNLIWVATGDRENECIIGNTSDGFKTLNVVFRGGQEYRAVNLLFYKDFIIYATDSQYLKNEIKKIDRRNFDISVLAKIQGSGIYGGQCGDYGFFSTSVEPSKVNKDKNSHLWLSRNGLEWEEIFKARKDIWNGTLFQFGSILFPQYNTTKPLKKFFFYGRALKKIGGSSLGIDLE
jgi:hypothetical protein